MTGRPHPEEAWPLLARIRRPPYRVCLSVIYACGLSLLEGVQLRVAQIDSAHLQLHIQAGKGNKYRYVPLPPKALSLLRTHWRTHRNRRVVCAASGTRYRRRGTTIAKTVGCCT